MIFISTKRKYEKPLLSIHKYYIPLDEFRYNNSREGGNHPNYVFGLTPDERFYSIGITTHPPVKGPNLKFAYQKLHKKVNPNSKSGKPDYICVNNVHHNSTSVYGKPLQGWRFSDEDKILVNSIIKKHKGKLSRSNKYSNNIKRRRKKRK